MISFKTRQKIIHVTGRRVTATLAQYLSRCYLEEGCSLYYARGKQIHMKWLKMAKNGKKMVKYPQNEVTLRMTSS